MPWYPPLSVAIAVLIPITSPRMSSSGPPLLPGLIAASVCMKSLQLMIRADVAAFGADDAGGDGRFETERRADRNRPIAHFDGLGIADLRGHQVFLIVLQLEDGEIGFRVGADQLGGVLGGVVVEFHLDPAGVLHHMKVGEDIAVAIDNHSGAGGLAPRKHALRRIAAERILSEEAAEQIVSRPGPRLPRADWATACAGGCGCVVPRGPVSRGDVYDGWRKLLGKL